MPSFTFATPGAIEADIDLGVAYVEVIASDRTDTLVEITPTKPNRSGDVSLARESTGTFENGRLRVSVPRRLNLFGQSDSADVRIELPAGSRLDIANTYGSVRLRGDVGAARIVAKYGSVTADRIGGDLVLNSPYGQVDIAEVAGRLDLEAGHGNARIGHVTGDARVRAAHGSVELGTTDGSVEVTTSGPFTIEHARGDVTARSAHGAIRVLEADGGVLRLENGYAPVEVGIPSGVAAWVDATSAHGAVRNELTPDPEAAGSGRTIQLHLRANWADVVIRRAMRRSA